jgi:outer membrane protein assembly factor BamB
MSGTMRLTDDAIRAALTPAAAVHAPAGLAAAIRAGTMSTPQRRPGMAGWAPTGGARLALRLAVVGLLLLGAVAAVLIAGSRRTAPPALPTTTTYHGGPARTGVMPGPGPAGDPRIEWNVALNGPVGPWSPAVAGGVVYIGDQGGFVAAFDEATGSPVWPPHGLGSPINSGVSVADGVLLLGDDDGVIHALDAATGAERWSYRTSGPVHSSGAVVDSVAYFGSLDGHLYALDVATGQLRWPVAVATAGPISRAIAVADGNVYAGSGGLATADAGTLGAYDAATGALRWSVALEPGNTSTPTVADGRVFVTGGLDATTATAHALYEFDISTGRTSWAAPFVAPTGKTLLIGAVAGGMVFAESTDGTLYTVDAATGALAWTARIQATQSPNAGVVGGVLYVTSDDRKIHAIDIATHVELWAIAVAGAPSSPAIVDGRIIVGTTLGRLVSIAGSSPPAGAAAMP